MAPIIPQTDTMETWQNREMRMAVSGAYPNFRILLAVLLQKSSVIVYICLFSHGGDKAGGRKNFFTSDLCLTREFKPVLNPVQDWLSAPDPGAAIPCQKNDGTGRFWYEILGAAPGYQQSTRHV
jgi:hypothetical protein